MGDKIDDVAEIERKLLETPGPETRVGARELGVARFEVGTDVGDPNVVALVDKPESHAALLVNAEVAAVAENTVLKHHRVTGRSRAARVADAVSFENPAALGDNVVFLALVAPVLEESRCVCVSLEAS